MIDDVDRIMAVMTTAFDPAYGEAWTRAQVEAALLMGNCHVLLIDESGREPGEGVPAAGFSLVRSVAGEDELLLIAVDPACRGQGLGAKLLDRVLEDGRRRSSRQVHLEMRRGNPAEQLYLTRGFVPVGLRPNYYRRSDGDRIDAITFCYEL